MTIIERGGGFIVCEGGEEISKPFAERSEAKSWLHYQRCWHQPLCCVCGSGITRADDPWEVYSVSRSTGADWMLELLQAAPVQKPQRSLREEKNNSGDDTAPARCARGSAPPEPMQKPAAEKKADNSRPAS